MLLASHRPLCRQHERHTQRRISQGSAVLLVLLTLPCSLLWQRANLFCASSAVVRQPRVGSRSQGPAVSSREPGVAPDLLDNVGLEFGSSPMGMLRRRFLADSGLPILPEPGRPAPWVHNDSVYEIVPHQVERDVQQLEYLVSKNVLRQELQQYVTDLVLPEYRRMLAIAQTVSEGRSDMFFMTHPQQDLAVFFSLQKRALHLHPGDSVRGDAISPQLDLDAIQEDYLQKEHHVAVIDNFFTQEALHLLRDFLLESTIWTEAKFGHVGAYLEAGFACPLVAQIDRELRSKFSKVLDGLDLEFAWAYMYDGSLGGIGTHADDSQVQINFFITPTEANLGANDTAHPGGGLILYGIGPPPEWGLDKYNSIFVTKEIEEVLSSVDHWNVTVPYVQNRAILFDSTYFHRTDSMNFKKGYKNRRINVTFLYGKRANLNPSASVAPSTKSTLSDARDSVEESQDIVENRERFYELFKTGDNWLNEESWEMLREMGL